MLNIIEKLSYCLIPLLVSSIIFFAQLNNVKAYDTFIEGAVEGLNVIYKIVGPLMAMLVAINILKASGLIEFFVSLLSPILNRLGIPGEIIPLGLIRPISGTASLAMVADLIKEYGPDSFIGRVASTAQGSTETTLYVVTLYLGAVNLKKSRHIIFSGILADLLGFVAAIFICKLVFT